MSGAHFPRIFRPEMRAKMRVRVFTAIHPAMNPGAKTP